MQRQGRAIDCGLIGCGRLAERGYLPALRRVRGARLVGVADPKPERCAALSAQVSAYLDGAALLSATRPDLVIIATPVAAHLPDARRAAAAGVPSLVEKPPAEGARDAAELAALNPRPWIGFNRRFDPALRRLRTRLRDMKPLEIAISLSYQGDRWEAYTVRDDTLLSLGPHLIDLARWLGGAELEGVRAPHLTELTAELEFELADGAGRALISCSKERPPLDRIEIRSPSGAVLRHSGRDPVRRILRRLRRPDRTELINLLVLQLTEVIGVLRGREPTVIADATDGLAVMEAIDAARSSARNGGEWQPIGSRRIEAH